MSTKIGHFEILSELSKSATGAVYKANDPQTSQTVALKAIQLSAFGERAAELEKCLVAEAETTKVLSHSNLAPVFGAGKFDGQFCAAMEYIQGNSIATMLARKEGFSIWDLLDIGRQVCAGLDHAQSHNVVHYSLEPAKIMCGWDGTVRILGYGVSSVGKFTDQMADMPLILHYMSPEQVRGENIDARSNLFSLGAIFYEMVTDGKAFNGADAEALRQAILDGALPAPVLVNPKAHPGLSDLIMKALAKDPAERYQNGRQMLDDLEKCKESKPKAAKQAPAKGTMVPDAVKAANQAKFVGAAAKPVAAQPAPAQPKPAAKPAAAASAPSKAVGAAASAGGRGAASAPASKAPASSPFAGAPATPTHNAPPAASMSSSVVEEPAEAEAPRIAVDPMMAEGGPAKSGVSFSEMTELPPLKEVYIPPPPPPSSHEQPAPQQASVTRFEGELDAPPKAQASEVAQKAIKEIKNVPPQLMIYSIAGAAVVILIIAVALVMHVNSLNSEGDSSQSTTAQVAQPAPVQPAPVQPAPVQSQPVPVQPVQAEPVQAQPVQAQPEQPAEVAPAPAEPQPVEPVQHGRGHKYAAVAVAKGKNVRRKGSATAAIVPTGQMAIDSTPQGAQVQVDGRGDPSWVTPFTLSGLTPGQHSVTVSKAGFSTDSRTVNITSSGKSFVQTHLSQLVATLAVTSTPAGASVYVDGKNTSRVTPAQIPVDKGQHVVLVRKSGFIDETTTAQFTLGQTVSFSPTLRELGNVDDIRTVGKVKKLFGGKEAQNMGTVSVKTQPKGAQVAVNQHMLDKESPVQFALDPGNYEVDITLTGYAPIHKVITVDKGGKAVIDEVMQRQ
jgi:eukaryotic-like serine/threonine-protein kinase